MLHRKASTPRDDRDAFVKILAGFVHEADEQYGKCPVGISLAGGMDPQTGSVISANIPAIKDWPLAAELSAILDRPVLVENDADCFALAEATTGAAQNARTVFAIILGTGVGAALCWMANSLAATVVSAANGGMAMMSPAASSNMACRRLLVAVGAQDALIVGAGRAGLNGFTRNSMIRHLQATTSQLHGWPGMTRQHGLSTSIVIWLPVNWH